MHKLILIIVSAFALLGSPALAKDAGSAAWVVTQLSGDARVVHRGLQPVALKTAARLSPGDRVVTGLTGRATLTRGADYIILAPRSDLQLPATPQPKGFTRVIQNLGTMLFKVKHTGVPHFAVDTPMLAAVVKGTTFTVIVDRDRSAVQVIEGAVQVTATDGGMSRLVQGGKTVFIDRNEPKRLIDADERSPAATTSSSTVKVTGSPTPSVATLASLTGGLVQPGSQGSAPASTAPTSAVPDGDPATTATKTTQPVVNVVDATAPAVTDTVSDVADTATDVVDTTTDTVTDVVDTTTDVVDTTTSGVTDTVTDVVGTAADAVDTTTSGVTDTVTDVVDTTTGTITDVVDTVTDVVDTTTDVVGTTTDTVTDVVDTTTDVVGTTTDTVTDTVTDVVDTVTDVVDTTTDTVVDVVDTTTDAVTDVLGGLLGTSGSGGDNSGSGSDNSGPGSDNSGSGSDNSGSGSDNSGPGSDSSGSSGSVADVVDTTTDVVVDVVDTTTDTVTDVVDTVTDVVDATLPEVVDPVAEVVDTVAEVVDTTVPDVVDTTTDVIGGILGGLFPR